MGDKVIKLAVTGSRPNKLKGGYNNNSKENRELISYFKKFIYRVTQKNKIAYCISGGALGSDTLWAIAALEVRDEYPNEVILEMAIPFEEQDSSWPKKSKDIYQNLLSQADKVINVTGEKSYKPWYMQKRNEYMVDNCDYLIAIYNGTKGGTHNCVTYANKKNVPIIVNSSFHNE